MNPFDLLKNTQAIKEQTEKLKEELASIRVEGYSGGKMEAQEYLSLGFHLSFSGSVTYHKDGCETEVIEALKITPPELMLIETDCPFLAPSPYRGIINEPKYVLVTAEHIADLLEKDVNEVIKQTRINTKKLLNLK